MTLRLGDAHRGELGDQLVDIGDLDACRALAGLGDLQRLDPRGNVDAEVGGGLLRQRLRLGGQRFPRLPAL